MSDGHKFLYLTASLFWVYESSLFYLSLYHWYIILSHLTLLLLRGGVQCTRKRSNILFTQPISAYIHALLGELGYCYIGLIQTLNYSIFFRKPFISWKWSTKCFKILLINLRGIFLKNNHSNRVSLNRSKGCTHYNYFFVRHYCFSDVFISLWYSAEKHL